MRPCAGAPIDADWMLRKGTPGVTGLCPDIHAHLPGGVDGDRVIKECWQQSVSDNLPFVVTNRRADGLAALGDPTRRAIFECLAERPRAVGELADALPVSRPAVSQHLKVLKDAGLVTGNANGTRRIYRLNPEGVAAMRDQLDTYWNRALDGYVQAVDQAGQEQP
jgi:DNA-binding transcriptional ArsR family regulator